MNGTFEDDSEADEDFEDPDTLDSSGDEEVVKEDTKRPAKQAARKKAVEEQAEDLTEQLSKMSVSSTRYSMDFKCPYIMYDYTEDDRECVSVDFLVPNQHRRFFRIKVQPGGKALELEIVVPPIFYDKHRVLYASNGDDDININTNKVTAFAKACKAIVKEKGQDLHGTTGDVEDEKEIISAKQVIQLPFAVEETLWCGIANNREGFEVIPVENDDVVLFNEMREALCFFILTVDMVKPEATARKPRGAMRKMVSPRGDVSRGGAAAMDEDGGENQDGA